MQSGSRRGRNPTLVSIKNAIGNIHTESAEQLRRGVNEAGLTGRWDIGHLLNELTEQGALPSNYGDAKMQSLAEDLRLEYGRGFAPRSLYYMSEFAHTFDRDSLDYRLSWSIYRQLLAIKSPKRREYFRRLSAERNLTTFELDALLRDEKGYDTDLISKRLSRPQGQLYTYALKSELGGFAAGRGLIDLGFGVYHRDVKLKVAGGDSDENVFKIERQRPGGGYIATPAARASDRYLYKAQISRIVDGDTFIVYVDLGFRVITRQRLRLRCVNAPELGQERGRAVMEFVERRLRDAPVVLIKTHATDKYDRYLSDILYLPDSKNEELILQEGLHLNRELIERSPAVFAWR